MSQHDTLTPSSAPMHSMPCLPSSLLDLIGNYGMARAECSVGGPEFIERYQALIKGIKDYAAAQVSATQPAQAAQGEPVQGVPQDKSDAAQILAAELRGNVAEKDYRAWALQVLPLLDWLTFSTIASPTLPAQPAVAQGAGEVVADLKRLASVCPELNLNNYGPDDVDELNAWAIEVSQAIDQLAPTQPAAGADALDAQRYRRLRDTNIQWVHKRAWISFEAQKEPGLSDIFETSEARNLIDAAIDAAIAASGRQS